MKLLRDFFRLRAAGRFTLAGRREAVRVPLTVTVPRPLTPSAERETVDMPWQVEAAQGRSLPRWNDHSADNSRTSRHLRLVSSH
ncbi:hypothetical protein [Dyella sp. 2HG41-7]|uniref:hypothetical protein n=1 Tax=Dyella sp. 2HG41-7 TaxID=2883239 RepID=UPI001F181828|nr:hypothetical protein [Dyella sp. 2HG41-7]